MSQLPQRRKSAEELAKLRENLGMPAEAPVPFSPENPLPPMPPRRGDHRQQNPPAPPTPDLPAPSPAPRPAKAVRSLRRSERLPLPERHTPARSAFSALPATRHNEAELNEIRRLNAIHNLNPTPPDFRMAAASLLWIIPGYVFAFGGAAFAIPQIYLLHPYTMMPGDGFHLMHPLSIVIAGEVLALAIAALIFYRRFYSRHHSAILAGIVFFTLVFAFLHFFPKLTHGS